MGEEQGRRGNGSEQEVTIEEALKFGLQLVSDERLEEAAAIFRRVLEVAPEHPDALNFLGIVTYHLGDHQAAADLVRRAAAMVPDSAGIQNNLGNILVDQGDIDGAIQAYKRSIELDPAQPEPLNNLALIFKARGQYAEAEELLESALALDDKHGPAYHNLGNIMLRTGRPREAIEQYRKAATHMPSGFHPYFIALAYKDLGEHQSAVTVLRDWIEKEPDNALAKHMFSAFTGESVPTRAADEVVEILFDSFASSFEAKLARLEYKAPQLVAEAFLKAVGSQRGDLVILDAGCGTGLCAPYLRGHARHLTGVDLSAGMLAKAAATRLYNELVKGELTAFLASKNAVYDAVVSADTLCYFGALEEFAAAAAGAIKPGGVLVFTVEALDDDAGKEHTITIAGRYAHSGRYLDRVFREAGFEVVACDSVTLRLEDLKPVAGFVFSARRI